MQYPGVATTNKSPLGEPTQPHVGKPDRRNTIYISYNEEMKVYWADYHVSGGLPQEELEALCVFKIEQYLKHNHNRRMKLVSSKISQRPEGFHPKKEPNKSIPDYDVFLKFKALRIKE